MTSSTTKRFRAAFAALPVEVQQRAKLAYALWANNPAHPSLHFKRVHSRKPIYSVRIGLGWRALGVMHQDRIAWFWIGPHAEYDALLSKF